MMTINIFPSGEGQFWDLGSRITCKVTSDSTNNEYTVLEVLLEKGQGSPLHIHRRESETIYITDGECVVGDGQEDHSVPAGSVIVFEKGTPHYFRNDGETKTKLIITAVPGGLDRYFEEVSTALEEEKPEKIESINRKYEIDFLEL